MANDRRQGGRRLVPATVRSDSAGRHRRGTTVNALPRRLLAPRHWGMWLVVGAAWLVARLPVPLVVRLGSGLGLLGRRLTPHRRDVVRKNLELCFGELDAAARLELERDVFRSTGIALVETAMAWLGPMDRFQERFTLQGLDVYRRALAEGRGVLVLGAHFTTLDLAGGLTGRKAGFAAVYRPHGNGVIDWLTRHGRERHVERVFDRRAIRRSVAHLRAGGALWYAPDQDYGAKHSVFAPFFGVAAATITITSRLAGTTGARVLFLSHWRDAARGTWHARFSDPFSSFPTGDTVQDATAINAVIERAVREHPAQYLWVHRRFKTRPEGEEPVY